MNEQPIELVANEYWVKIVEFLQQNWAVIEAIPESENVEIVFLGIPQAYLIRSNIPAKSSLKRPC